MTRRPRSHVRSFKKTNLVIIVFTMEPGCAVVEATEQKKLSAFTGNELGARGVWELVRHIVVTFSRGGKFS